MTKIRINKYLAQTGLGSRREVDELIKEGQIKVNKQPAELGMKIDPEKDKIFVKGKAVSIGDQREELVYFKLNKPVDVVSTAADPDGRKTVLNLVKSKARIYPVGRLDVDSEGLILLTNDGDLTYKLTHPKFEIEKEYVVWANGNLTDKALKKLKTGIRLSDGKTSPAQVYLIWRRQDQVKFKIIITEGRQRQVRRMSAVAGLTVTRLMRTRMGSLKLGDLDVASHVKLTIEEIQNLKSL
ncbi:MAG: pseudouridine synthase [Patescibacteria group bacterium]|nr:pseudouridine synthase [Patescibacteria group bacterium]